jgi:hypothetical protein
MKHITMIAGIAAMLAVFVIDSAGARISSQQAWSHCLKSVNAIEPRTATNGVHRTAQMKACLARMGYPHG